MRYDIVKLNCKNKIFLGVKRPSKNLPCVYPLLPFEALCIVSCVTFDTQKFSALIVNFLAVLDVGVVVGGGSWVWGWFGSFSPLTFMLYSTFLLALVLGCCVVLGLWLSVLWLVGSCLCPARFGSALVCSRLLCDACCGGCSCPCRFRGSRFVGRFGSCLCRSFCWRRSALVFGGSWLVVVGCSVGAGCSCWLVVVGCWLGWLLLAVRGCRWLLLGVVVVGAASVVGLVGGKIFILLTFFTTKMLDFYCTIQR